MKAIRLFIFVFSIGVFHIYARVDEPVAKSLNVAAQDDQGDSALHVAAAQGDIVQVKRLLKALVLESAVDVRNYREETPLHVAAANGRVDVIKLLIEHSADVNARDSNNSTPLHWATLRAYPEVVRILMQQGHADVNAVNDMRATPLHNAAGRGKTDIINMLLDGGADVNARDKRNGTPLDYAAARGNLETVRLLLAHGAHINKKIKGGLTTLHLAARNGHKDIVEALLATGDIAVDARDKNNMTALDLVNQRLKILAERDNRTAEDDALIARFQETRNVLEGEIKKIQEAQTQIIRDFAERIVKTVDVFLEQNKSKIKMSDDRVKKMLSNIQESIQKFLLGATEKSKSRLMTIIWNENLRQLFGQSQQKSLLNALMKQLNLPDFVQGETLAKQQKMIEEMKAAAEPKKEPKRRDEDGGSGAIAQKKQIKISTKPVLEEVVTIEQQRSLKESGKKQALEHVIEHRTISV